MGDAFVQILGVMRALLFGLGEAALQDMVETSRMKGILALAVTLPRPERRDSCSITPPRKRMPLKRKTEVELCKGVKIQLTKMQINHRVCQGSSTQEQLTA